MKRDDLGIANELSVIGRKIYAVGSLIGSKTDNDSDPAITNDGIFIILAEISKRLEKISCTIETQALAAAHTNFDRSPSSGRTPLVLVKTASDV